MASMSGISGGKFQSGDKRTTSILPGGPVPGSATLQDWRELMDSDPGEIGEEDVAHMARVRELARSLSLKDLCDRIEAGMAETVSNGSVSVIVGTLIQELARRDAAQACELLFRKNYWRSDGNVFEEWGRQDPQSAFAWIEAHPEFQRFGYQIIRAWAESSPEAAFQKLLAWNEDGTLQASDPAGSGPGSRMSFFPQWAKRDPEAAVAALVSGSELGLDFCLNAYWSDALRVMNAEKRERLISALQAIPDLDLRASSLSAAAGFFAAEDDAAKAIPFTEDKLIPDYRMREMRRQILETWIPRGDPEAAAEWFWSTSPPGQEAAVLQQILGIWSGYCNHQTDTVAWLQSLPPGRLPANAAQIFVVAAFPNDPVPALHGWVTLQPGGEVSAEAVDRLGQYLSSAPQATRLPALLIEAGFSDELRARLLSAADQGGEPP
jgi:hypothetical protein